MWEAIVLVVLAATVIAFVPCLLLFVLKHAFKLAITYSFDEWLAAVLLMFFIGAAAVL